ncbi:MAG: type II secretion system GspH family protein [Gammaproteobacteria bacterium]|nr:type II secretion system GspH family protein [Gammaproteobacteria bacterium]NND39979.1 type II secretion system protein [Pseudomonadales bacterium]NNM10992.1 type II secretion system protein [Pseudomonadales bacterium]RZV60071.1 MAG: type II secretion system protein [Pseudomonadales bacterium]
MKRSPQQNYRATFVHSAKPYAAAGFTFVELVAVIVLISILAAIAAPRFFDLKDDAEAAALQALAGSFSAGVAIGKAQWIANGNSANSVTAVDQRVIIDGVGFNVNRFGWLDSTTLKESQDLTVTGQTARDCQEVFEYILQNPPRNTIAEDFESRRKAKYAVRVVEGSTSDRCRYELVVRAAQSPENAEFYFDYEMTTGRVTVNLPEGL